MPVDNELYDRLRHTWWDDAGFLNILHSALNPARVAFLERALRSHFGDFGGLRVLDVGCGGGLLAEELARRGCSVTGIDPSRGSLAVAREHAARGDWQVDYRAGVAESLPLPESAVDAVVCCDVLEHVETPASRRSEARTRQLSATEGGLSRITSSVTCPSPSCRVPTRGIGFPLLVAVPPPPVGRKICEVCIEMEFPAARAL